MAAFITDIPDVGPVIHKAFMDGVFKRVLRHTGIKLDSVIYTTPYGTNLQPGSTVGEQQELSYGTTERVYVDVEERRDAESLNDFLGYRDGQTSIYKDSVVGVEVFPLLARYDIEATITYRGVSRAMVSKWANDINRLLALNGALFETEASFHYNVPPAAMLLIYDIYDAACVKCPQPPLDEYLAARLSPTVTSASTVTGSAVEYIVRNTVSRLLCRFDPSTEIIPEKDSEGGAWRAQLHFRLSYERPEQMAVVYQPVVCNTLLDEKWWQTRLAPGLGDDRYAISQDGYTQPSAAPADDVIALPIYMPACDFPDLKSLSYFKREFNLIVGYFEMNPDELHTSPVSVFALTDLGNVSFPDYLVEYMKKAYALDAGGKESAVRVFIYENGRALSEDKVRVDPQTLTVNVEHAFDMTKLYQFTVTLRTGYDGYTQAGKDLIMLTPELVGNLIVEFYPGVVTKPGVSNAIKDIVNGNDIYIGDFEDLVDEISRIDNQIDNSKMSARPPLTVTQSSVIVYHGDE